MFKKVWDVYVVYVFEVYIDFEVEVVCFNKVMDEVGNVIIFLFEGVGLDVIIEEMEKDG